MVKTLGIGMWACVVALLASFFAAQWKADVKPAPDEGPALVGLEHRKLEPMTVPVIQDGVLQGYILARLVFTADAGAMSKLSMDPAPFVTDEAFREFYNNGKVEFGRLAKYNLDRLINNIKENTNKRLGPGFIQDILVEEINYVDRRSMGQS
ncbi:hypothetical protein J2R99_002142 [Rhodopseudomonas julia]|uniref:Flagellar basal body-associated protein FliL n=1 Tax=Rhodopseudomonas julia TaxID=200617 RepID=A0ABU0C7U0_9BRAD|nr:hypothetical protein [Rhodopseudomonas julia]MDQ0326273.1 hypothetical protein [Rhodopseudomonas julia]